MSGLAKKLAKRKRFLVKLRKGKNPKQHPIYNLAGSQKIAWDKSYERAVEKLAQDIRPIQDPQLIEVIKELGQLYHRRHPEMFEMNNETLEEWVEDRVTNPAKAVATLANFSRITGSPVFSNAAYLLSREYFPEEAATGGAPAHAALKPLEQPRRPIGEVDKVRAGMMASDAGLAALSKAVPHWSTRTLPYVADLLMMGGVGSGKQRFEKDVAFELPALDTYIPEMGLILDKFEAQTDIEDLVGEGANENDPQMRAAIERKAKAEFALQERVTRPEATLHLDDARREFYNTLVGQGAESASDLSNVLLNQPFGTAVAGYKNWSRRDQALVAAARASSRIVSPADERILGTRLLDKYGPYEAGTLVDEKVRDFFISKGIDEPVVVPDRAWQQFGYKLSGAMKAGRLPGVTELISLGAKSKGWTAGALLRKIGGKGSKAVAQSADILGATGRIAALAPDAAKAAKRINLVKKSWRWVKGAAPRLAKWLKATKASKWVGATRLAKFVKGAKPVPVIGTIIGAVADVFDGVYHSITDEGSRMEDQALSSYLRSSQEYPWYESVGRGVGSVPYAVFDPQPLRNRLQNLGMEALGATDWKDAVLRDDRQAVALLNERAKAYKDLLQAMPGIGTEQVGELADEIAFNRVETRMGKRPARRQISTDEKSIVDALGITDPKTYNLATDIMREAGVDAFKTTFFIRGPEGVVPVTANVNAIRNGAARNIRFQSPDLRRGRVRYDDPRKTDPKYLQLQKNKKLRLEEERRVEFEKEDAARQAEQQAKLDELTDERTAWEKEQEASVQAFQTEQRGYQQERERLYQEGLQQQEQDMVAWQSRMNRQREQPVMESPQVPQPPMAPPEPQLAQEPEPAAPIPLSTVPPPAYEAPELMSPQEQSSAGYGQWMDQQLGLPAAPIGDQRA